MMLKYRIRGIDLCIWLSNGIYFFPPESAEGKTFVYSLLKDVRGWDNTVLPLTYRDYTDGTDIPNLLRSKEYSVVMLDRFDLYQTREIADVLGELSYKIPIMIDVKNELIGYRGILSGCYIEFTAGKLEVLPV